MFAFITQLEFSHPMRFVALAVIPLVIYCALRSVSLSAVWQRVVSALCRTLIVVLLVAAVAGIAHRGPTSQKYVVFVTDVSRSIGEESQEAARQHVRDALAGQGDHKAAFVSFAGDVGAPKKGSELFFQTGQEANGTDSQEKIVLTPFLDLQPMASHPAEAVLMAAGVVPPMHVPHIVLLTDGNETAGDLLTAVKGTGMPVSVVPLKPFAAPEACIDFLRVVPPAGPDLPFLAEVTVRANYDGQGDVKLSWDGNLVRSQETLVTKQGTRLVIALPDQAVASPFSRVEAELVVAKDAIEDNNRRSALVFPQRLIRVLVAAGGGGRTNPPVAAALKSEGFKVTVRRPADLPETAGPLNEFDLLVLSNVPPGEVGQGRWQAVHEFVHDRGGGLIVLGGDAAFGPEAYAKTELEPMLPVTALHREEEKKHSLAMVLILDKSKSMDQERRMDLAKVAARKTVELLTPQDKIGILAFGTDTEWVSEIRPCSDKLELVRRIKTLTTGGVTNMYPALEKAYLALRQADADQRHVILLTDGVPTPGDFDSLAEKMADARISVSTVSVSPGADQIILRDIARIAKGEHHHCDDPAQVPNVFEREVRERTKPPVAREVRPFELRALPDLPIANAPALSGYTATSPKPGAELLLVAAEGDPLLGWWRYGKGVTAAFTCDAGDHWWSWPQRGKFFGALARLAARTAHFRDRHVQVTRSGGRAAVTLQAVTADAAFINDGSASAKVALPGGKTKELEMPLVAPGRFEAGFDAATPGQYTLDIAFTLGEGDRFQQSRGFVVDYPDELKLASINEKLLRSVASVSGGKYDPAPQDVFAEDGRRVDRVTPLWWYLAAAAVALFVFDVALRRLRLGGGKK